MSDISVDSRYYKRLARYLQIVDISKRLARY